MKSLKSIQTLSKVGKILSKIAIVLASIGLGGSIAVLVSLLFGSEGLIKIGEVTLHGLISWNPDGTGIVAEVFGWLIVCAGEVVLACFAESFFKNELKAGTPFTLAGAKELLRLGILALILPEGCAVIKIILRGIFIPNGKVAAMDLLYHNRESIVLGIMFIIGSLLCRYGAELRESAEDQ